MKSLSNRFSDSRFYTPDGHQIFEIPKKSGNGMKRPTITDAKENGCVWLPSVTTIIKTLAKPALQDWLIMQAVKAVLNAKRGKGETNDQLMDRILIQERVQDEESGAAADLGTAIHEALSQAVKDQPYDPAMKPYVEAVMPTLVVMGRTAWSEKIIVGDGYAGRGDIAQETDRHIAIIDFKTTGKVPRDAYKEHRMQIAAYCKANGNSADKHVIGGILYISTSDPGMTNLCLLENWENDYELGFKPLLGMWQYMNDYYPQS